MIVTATFPHSLELEQALAMIENLGVAREHIVVWNMETEPQHDLSFQQPPYRTSVVETGIAAATGIAVIGASVGFILPWGPIICGLAAALAGFAVGCLFQMRLLKKKGVVRKKRPLPEVVVVIDCTHHNAAQIRDIVWAQHALSVGSFAQN
ncbi:hypothetical protein ACFFK0_24025 [Paenibacillus chartarius]|uniref:DUF1269 domain-containing protein n=1 Tax=Paenibacillus chartarius TaxID=747481 RepID=A0ABV6DS37_9BACL